MNKLARAAAFSCMLASAAVPVPVPVQAQPSDLPDTTASVDSPPGAQAQSFRVNLVDLGLSKDTDRAQQNVTFRARADHVLTAATLELRFDARRAAIAFERIDVLLNGELLQSIEAKSLHDNAGQRRVIFDPTLLASSNQLGLRMHAVRGPTAAAASECQVSPGAWSTLQSGALQLSSLPLPLPNDLAQLPLPFFDDTFEHAQQVNFVLPRAPTEGQLKAAALVAGWFALQGHRRLSFAASVAELPAGDAVVIADGPAALSGLGLGTDEGITPAGLALRDNPRAPGRKLLLVYGVDAELLSRAASGLLRDGYDLKGAAVSFPARVDLPPLAAFEVPRWAAGPAVALGTLPEAQTLKASGGHAQTLKLSFRLTPDLFVWPRDYVMLDLSYEQGISVASGPAQLHVMLNGKSIGTLPSKRRGRSQLRLPRSSLRGYNELLLQVSYKSKPGAATTTCAAGADSPDDPAAWVALKPDSRLNLDGAHRYALLPDLQLFIYDGFPFTAQGDLRDTSVLLPAEPSPSELSSMLSLFAHFAAITGYAATKVDVRLGDVEPESLAGRDVMLIAVGQRHPLLERYRAELPLAVVDSELTPQRPARSNILKRVITGQLDDTELERAKSTLEAGASGAVFALPTPWDDQRSWVVISASSDAQLPEATALQGFAKGERAYNDLLLLQSGQRYLFELGTQNGRGQVDDLLALRFWLSHAWVALAGLTLLAAMAWGLFARGQLSELARRRLDEAKP